MAAFTRYSLDAIRDIGSGLTRGVQYALEAKRRREEQEAARIDASNRDVRARDRQLLDMDRSEKNATDMENLRHQHNLERDGLRQAKAKSPLDAERRARESAIAAGRPEDLQELDTRKANIAGLEADVPGLSPEAHEMLEPLGEALQRGKDARLAAGAADQKTREALRQEAALEAKTKSLPIDEERARRTAQARLAVTDPAKYRAALHRELLELKSNLAQGFYRRSSKADTVKRIAELEGELRQAPGRVPPISSTASPPMSAPSVASEAERVGQELEAQGMSDEQIAAELIRRGLAE